MLICFHDGQKGTSREWRISPLPFANLSPFVLHNDLNEWRKTDINQTLLPVQTLVVSDLCLSTELVQLLNQTECIAGAAIIAHRLQDTVHLTPVLPHGRLQFLECFLYVLNHFAVYITSWRKWKKIFHIGNTLAPLSTGILLYIIYNIV